MIQLLFNKEKLIANMKFTKIMEILSFYNIINYIKYKFIFFKINVLSIFLIIFIYNNKNQIIAVAPFAGAWIETTKVIELDTSYICVAPFAGAWIETTSKG